ncbi:MAG: hypothetical protein ACK41Q_10805, partial [Candidatus Brocadia sp.]
QVCPCHPLVLRFLNVKAKKTLSLDLAIVAVDWGYGRRHNWLSDYHLAARDEKTGEYIPDYGKDF